MRDIVDVWKSTGDQYVPPTLYRELDFIITITIGFYGSHMNLIDEEEK